MLLLILIIKVNNKNNYFKKSEILGMLYLKCYKKQTKKISRPIPMLPVKI